MASPWKVCASETRPEEELAGVGCKHFVLLPVTPLSRVSPQSPSPASVSYSVISGSSSRVDFATESMILSKSERLTTNALV